MGRRPFASHQVIPFLGCVEKTPFFEKAQADALATARPRRPCSPAVLIWLATQPGGGIGATTGTVDFLALTFHDTRPAKPGGRKGDGA